MWTRAGVAGGGREGILKAGGAMLQKNALGEA